MRLSSSCSHYQAIKTVGQRLRMTTAEYAERETVNFLERFQELMGRGLPSLPHIPRLFFPLHSSLPVRGYISLIGREPPRLLSRTGSARKSRKRDRRTIGHQ